MLAILVVTVLISTIVAERGLRRELVTRLADETQIDTAVSDAKRTVYLAAVVALAFGTGVAAVSGHIMGRPLRQLARAARQLANGSPPTYPTSSVPEIRDLVHALKTMREQLADRIATIETNRAGTSALIESMIEGVVAADASGSVLVCNTAMRRLLERESDATLPNIKQLFGRADTRAVVDEVLAGQSVSGLELMLGTRTVLVTARPLPAGGGVICAHDITNLRRLENVRRDFVANVSHELKTPLTNIAGYSETLLHDPVDTETAQRFLQVIHANTQRMQHLVDDLLDLAKLESGGWRPAPQRVDLREGAALAWAPLADRAGSVHVNLSLTMDSGFALVADPSAFHQILTNLFDNALRYSSEGGRIEVIGNVLDQGTEVLVRDSGTGIAAEHLPRIFERFYRADPARSRAQGGTGLGLSIVKHLMEAHSGYVEVRSAFGHGTTVRLFFPHDPPTLGQPDRT